MSAERVHRSGVHERFQNALVADAQVDSLAELEQRVEGAVLLSCVEDRIDRGAPDVTDSTEPEANVPLADDRELVAGFVDVRRKYLESRFLCARHVQLPRLVDVLDDVVRVADLR